MPKIGLKYPVYALATETSSAISYASGAVLAKAISANIAITANNTKLPADDIIAESDKSFASGTISLNIDDLLDAAKIAILNYIEGAEVDAAISSKELSGGNTSPALIGLGFYGKRVRAGVTSWRAIWLKKVQFAEPADEFKTKGESVEFLTPTLEGEIMLAVDNKWKEEGTFSTESGAIAWLNGKAGISSAVSNNITTLTITNGTVSPTFAEATRYYSCVVTGDVKVKAVFAAGTAKLYINGAYAQTLVTNTDSTEITFGSGTNALYEIIVQESGKTAVTYSIMMQRA